MADGTFPESIGFIMFVDPVVEPKVFGERTRGLEGIFYATLCKARSVGSIGHCIKSHKNALGLASIGGPQGSELPPIHLQFLLF